MENIKIMASIFRELISKNELAVDTIAVSTLIGLCAYILGWSYALVWVHQAWDGMSFSTGFGIIIGTMAGAKRVRDGNNQ
jgi:hypothetical protein